MVAYKGKDLFAVFMKKLDCYSLIFYSLTGCNIQKQLKSFKLASKFGQSEAEKRDHQQLLDSIVSQFLSTGMNTTYVSMYFQCFEDMLLVTPQKFKPRLIKNWIEASSDVYEDQPKRMIELCKKLESKLLPAIDADIAKGNYDIFDHKRTRNAIKNEYIALKGTLSECVKQNKVGDKYTLADIQNR